MMRNGEYLANAGSRLLPGGGCGRAQYSPGEDLS
jgi:hypothetical protein